jgi:acetyl-CoA C-acetyltransferase
MNKYGRRVAVVGVGATKDPGSHHPFKSWKDLVADAFYEALENTDGMKPTEIDGVVVGYHGETVNEQGGIGGSVADLLGIAPTPVFPHSMNCASGAVSIHTAWEMVASGKFDKVAAIGFDKEGDNINYTECINISFESEYDYVFGFRHRDGFELLSNYYIQKYNYDYSPYAALAYQANWYARRNTRAHNYGKPMPNKEDLFSPNSCFSIMGEGAAAVILVPEEDAYKYTKNPVFLDGVSLRTSSHYIAHRLGEQPFGNRYPESLNRENSWDQIATLYEAAKDAYNMAGITVKDVDFCQVYDLLTTPFVCIEALGICEPGQGGQFYIDGETAIDGKCPVNTDGGNIARGHASGADGMNGFVEAVIQLRGEAGERQVPDAKVGVVSGLGSVFTHMTVAVLRKDN